MHALKTLSLIAFAVMALAACTPESHHPLPADTRTQVDERLVGTWRADILGNRHVAVVTRGDPGVLNVTLSSVTLEGARDGVAPKVTHHQLTFYNFKGTPVIAEHGPSLVDGDPVYRFASYHFADDGSVTLDYLGQHEIWKWVSSLRLGGEMRSDDPLFRDIIVRGSSQNLAAVMRHFTPKQLFNVPFGPFTRQ